MSNDFKDKVVIVTGGAQGIGRATVEKFYRSGAKVVVVDLDEEKAIELLSDLSLIDSEGEATFLKLDVGCPDELKQMADKVVAVYGRIDTLVNIAACFIIKGIDASYNEWQQVFRTNVIGYALAAQACLPELKKTEGSIVNMSSISGLIAQPGYMTYNTSKAAVINMTKCMAQDFAPFNVRVNSVSPGTVWTKNNEFYIGRDYGVDLEGANKHPEIGGKHMLERVAQPEEVANAIFFLASKEAGFITAENLVIDGGYVSQ